MRVQQSLHDTVALFVDEAAHHLRVLNGVGELWPRPKGIQWNRDKPTQGARPECLDPLDRIGAEDADMITFLPRLAAEDLRRCEAHCPPTPQT